MNSNLQKLISKLQLPKIDKELDKQLNNYIEMIKKIDYFKIDKRVLEAAKLTMLTFQLNQFIFSRENRTEEVASVESQEAISIKRRLFPLWIPKTLFCVDGRVLSQLVFALHGNAIHSPAADNNEFLPNKNADGLFLKEGYLSKIFTDSLKKRGNLCVVLDSHLGCAARGESEIDRLGHKPEDGGTHTDINRKHEMAKAIIRYFHQENKKEKQVIVIQTSYDPHTGYIYMGLATEPCLQNPKALKEGYTEQVLKELVNSNKAIYSKIITDRFEKLFQKNYFEIDYEKEYKKSTNKFWKKIEKMLPEILPFVDRKLKDVFSRFKQKENNKELKQRAILLIANAYTAFLHSYNKDHYPYGEHDESLIVVNKSEKGPFNRAKAFTIDPQNPNISSIIKLIEGLIRKNRINGKMTVYEKETLNHILDNDLKKYQMFPIPIIFFERLEENFDKSIIKQIQMIDWSDLSEQNWMTMTDLEFNKYLDNKYLGIPALVANKINDLRKKAIDQYYPGRRSTSAFLEGRLIPVWLLCGHDNKFISLIPFLAKGYEQVK